MEGGPPKFRLGFTCLALLESLKKKSPIRGYNPLWLLFPKHSSFSFLKHRPGSLSLVATRKISVDFFSSGYLDISVLRVSFFALFYSRKDVEQVNGFPHSDIHGSKVTDTSPQLFAVYHVLHRLLLPRHPPNALLIFLMNKSIAYRTKHIC